MNIEEMLKDIEKQKQEDKEDGKDDKYENLKREDDIFEQEITEEEVKAALD